MTEDDYSTDSLCESRSGFYLNGFTNCGSGVCYDKLWASIPSDGSLDNNNYASFLGNPYGFSYVVDVPECTEMTCDDVDNCGDNASCDEGDSDDGYICSCDDGYVVFECEAREFRLYHS